MKTMKNFLSMSALALVGAVMTGCSSDDTLAIDQQPEKNNNVVTLTTTVSLDENGSDMRALTAAGVKTFAVDEKVALFYKDEYNNSRKVESNALVAGDITNEGKTATLTFDLSANAPKSDGKYRLVYPASIAKDNIEVFEDVDDDWYTVKITDLFEGQDGTIANISNKFDLSINDGSFTSGQFSGSISLRNQLAILALTLKNSGSNISNLQEVFVCGAYAIYHFQPNNDPNDPIYVAIQPTPGSGENLEVYAKAGEYVYGKMMTTSKEYEKGHIYPISLDLPQMKRIIVTGNNGSYDFYYNEGDKWEDTIGAPLGGYAVNNYFGWIIDENKVTNYNEGGYYLYDSNNSQYASKTDAINSSHSYVLNN
jgi:hypothetical protein